MKAIQPRRGSRKLPAFENRVDASTLLKPRPKPRKHHDRGIFVSEVEQETDDIFEEEMEDEYGGLGTEREKLDRSSRSKEDRYLTLSDSDDSVFSLRRPSASHNNIQFRTHVGEHASTSSDDSIAHLHPRPNRHDTIHNRTTQYLNTAYPPSTPHHFKPPPLPTLPPIRRIIAQKGPSFRVEYLPTWLHVSRLPAPLLHEWTTLSQSSENILSYTPSLATNTTATTTGINKLPTAWTILRNEVPSDNDSGPSMARMLHETVQRAAHELSSSTLTHVLSAEYEWTSGSRAKAAQLMQRDAATLDVKTCLTHLATKLAPRERKQYAGIKVHWLGQIDSRISSTTGCTHDVSVVALLAPVTRGWPNPLSAWQARNFFREMSSEDAGLQVPGVYMQNPDDETIRSEYATLQSWKRTLIALISTAPWLLTPSSHLASLLWLLCARRTLKRLFLSWGVQLHSDWHTYVREEYLPRYHEDVGDARGWHDLMETSLFLNTYFKELRLAEEGVRDVDWTEDEGDSDLGEGERVVACKGRKRARSVYEEDGDALVEISGSSDDEVEEEYVPVVRKAPDRKHIPRKSRSSKAPRRAQMMDVGGVALAKKGRSGAKRGRRTLR